jgi:hypothetical protein
MFSAVPAVAADVEESRSAVSIAWTTAFDYETAIVSVSGPAGVTTWEVPRGQTAAIEVEALMGWASARSLPLDGTYNYEVRFMPKVNDDGRAALEQLRVFGVGSGLALPQVIGFFTIADGVIIGLETDASEEGLTKDQVIIDDLVIDGSLCVGMDCINGENFGFDTIRLKENNLRIRFQDTSTTASFPTNDWQIVANDSANGGASYLAFEDVDRARKPFLVEGGSRNSALYVDDSGRVGLGTSTPAEDLHIWYGDTPTIRLHQSGSGWAPQTWDISGNEANFFIRDVTNSSKLPFRIQPGTPSSALSLKSSGNIGVGTWDPDAPLEIQTTGKPATVLLENTGKGTWYVSSADDGTFTIATSKTAGDELLIIDASGNLTTSGTVNGISDVHAKRDFVPVDGSRILAAVARLAVTEWSLISDDDGVRHVGPTAQAFRAAFGLGADENHIALSDMGGVALAAIKGLVAELEDRDRKIDDLSRRLSDLEARVGQVQ